MQGFRFGWGAIFETLKWGGRGKGAGRFTRIVRKVRNELTRNDQRLFFCEKWDGHSKCERMEIFDLHLKRVFAG